ncbi:MAG TPA: AraC family transcriptional regulator [Clostridia bacterium]|nr:AraC family transcriptional regulator [Clostridia bacterium]
MSYPPSLPKHSRPEWTREAWFKDGMLGYVRSFTHVVQPLIGMHQNAFYELNIILEGEGRHYNGANAYAVSRGYAFVVPPNVRHGFWSDQSMHVFHGLIQCGFFEQYDLELRSLPGFTMLCEIEPYLQIERSAPLFLRMYPEMFYEILPDVEDLIRQESSEYHGRDIVKNARMLSLLARLSQFTSQTLKPSDRKATDAFALIIARSMEYIRTHSNQKLSVDELAQQANMARSTYIRYFNRVCGKTPSAFITKCRVVHARKLLCYSDHPLIYIAQECGFYDSSHFIRTFTQLEGVNPSEYRLIHAGGRSYPLCSLCASGRR